ncbi:hypothetical protein IR073_02985 [Gemella sp. 19428wG2_WT2a]|nr:hypothetical protein [Gemella sp. 19428wG2_WT2a]TFU59963.1 hypothetical protein E4T67_02965 [Gemella sp. WT2a]
MKDTRDFRASYKLNSGIEVSHKPFSLDNTSLICPKYSDEDLNKILKEEYLIKAGEKFDDIINKIVEYAQGSSKFTFSDVKQYLNEIISIDEFETKIENNYSLLKINKEVKLYRAVRLLNNKGETNKDFNPIEWRKINPKPSLQRLNTKEEQMFYLAGHPRIAMEEVGIEAKDEKFIVYEYKILDDFFVIPLQINPFLENRFSNELKQYGEIITKILNVIFSVKNNINDQAYIISNYIKDTYYSLNRRDKYEGWSYVSVAFKEAINYKHEYSEKNIGWACVALPKDTYEKYIDLKNVTCIAYNYTALEFSKLKKL